MPISLSAKKAARKSARNRQTNITVKRRVKTAVKSYLRHPDANKLKDVFSVLDKAAKKNIFRKNKIARLKSKYSKKMLREPVASQKGSKKQKAPKSNE